MDPQGSKNAINQVSRSVEKQVYNPPATNGWKQIEVKNEVHNIQRPNGAVQEKRIQNVVYKK
ncbi:Lipoprotein [Caenorhabditis elegans]|uniref:Lipoprotein n=1 Tax=Caenorhabditis elegans TaxID=6239 RepID=B4DCT1_CAEEL|nr:Lipoprotein [Caenorhabditis elegans]CCD73710.1 Lipoprotein [Caenorhabditis elegans]|eukprot:NP_001129832.1 Uncharacterized protein CELE_ZK355.8 [Caenorhabditis elegans]